MNELLIPVVTAGLIGLVLAILLAIASKIFAVEKDEKEEMVLTALPGANCGACGYTGCAQYAKAVVEGELITKCSVGGPSTVEEISKIMGVKAGAVEVQIAHVKCKGGTECKDDFIYEGIKSCKAENLIAGGHKACKYSCLGGGDCVAACEFDAIYINDKNRAEVRPDKCVGCKACVKACPLNIIQMVSKKQKTIVECMNMDKGAIARKACDNACIACKMCEKACNFEAIHVSGNLAEIDYEKCVDCTACARKCPTGAIRLIERVKKVQAQ